MDSVYAKGRALANRSHIRLHKNNPDGAAVSAGHCPGHQRLPELPRGAAATARFDMTKRLGGSPTERRTIALKALA
ncbi:MAG: hypothetical protein ACREXI_15575, partial [Caldimonas sp.]